MLLILEKRRRALVFGWMVGATLLLWSNPAATQRVSLDSARVNDTLVVHALRLAGGSMIVGRITNVSPDSVRVASSGSTTTIARVAVREVKEYAADALRNGELWFENPHVTRLLFSPTAIPLRKGEGYFSNFWVFLLSAAGGVTDRFIMGGGMTLIPGIDVTDNIFYALPKYTLVNQPKLKFAVGGLLASVGAFGSNNRDSKSVGVLYGVGTVGGRESNLTVGSGWGYVGNDLSSNPVITLGGQHRVSKRVALITENWFLPFEGSNNLGIFTYGVRLLGEKIAVDLAFASSIEGDSSFFPGLPLLGFAFKF